MKWKGTEGSPLCTMIHHCPHHPPECKMSLRLSVCWNIPKYSLNRWLSHKVHHWATILRLLPTIWFLHDNHTLWSCIRTLFWGPRVPNVPNSRGHIGTSDNFYIVMTTSPQAVALYCVVLYSIEMYLIVLHAISLYCMMHCMVLHSIIVYIACRRTTA